MILDHPPTVSDQTISVNGTIPIRVQLAGSDPDQGDKLTFSLVQRPLNAVLSDPSGNLSTYYPNPGFIGQDKFIYRYIHYIIDILIRVFKIQARHFCLLGEIMYSLMYGSLNLTFERHSTMSAYVNSKLFHITLFKNHNLIFFFSILSNYISIDMIFCKDMLYDLLNLLNAIFINKSNDIVVVIIVIPISVEIIWNRFYFSVIDNNISQIASKV